MHEIIISPDETILDAPLDMLEYFESEKPVHVSNIHLIDNSISPLIGTLTYGDKSLEVDLDPGRETRYFLHFLYTQGYRIADPEGKRGSHKYGTLRRARRSNWNPGYKFLGSAQAVAPLVEAPANLSRGF